MMTLCTKLVEIRQTLQPNRYKLFWRDFSVFVSIQQSQNLVYNMIRFFLVVRFVLDRV